MLKKSLIFIFLIIFAFQFFAQDMTDDFLNTNLYQDPKLKWTISNDNLFKKIISAEFDKDANIYKIKALDKKSKFIIYEVNLKTGDYKVNYNSNYIENNTSKFDGFLHKYEELNIKLRQSSVNKDFNIIAYDIQKNIKKYQILLSENSSFVPYVNNDKNIIIAKDGKSKDLIIYNLITGEEILRSKKSLNVKEFFIYENNRINGITILTRAPLKLIQVDLIKNKIEAEVLANVSHQSEEMMYDLKIYNEAYFVLYQDAKINNNRGIYVFNMNEKKLLWNKSLLSIYPIQVEETENDIITFDQLKLYRFNKLTGETVWEKEVKSIKAIKIKDNIINVITGNYTLNSLSKNLGISGFAKINIKDGSIINAVDTPNVISNIYKKDNFLYFADTKNIYTYDINSGKIINQYKFNEEFKENPTEGISGTHYLPDKNQIILITYKFVILYDLNNNKTIKINKLSNSYFLYQIIDYKEIILLFTFDIGPGNIILYCIDTKIGSILWDKKIGQNNKELTLAFLDFTYSGFDSLLQSYAPGFKILYENNCIVSADYSPDFSFSPIKGISCYNLDIYNAADKNENIKPFISFGTGLYRTDPIEWIETKIALQVASVTLSTVNSILSSVEFGNFLSGVFDVNIKLSGINYNNLYTLSYDLNEMISKSLGNISDKEMLLIYRKFLFLYYKDYINKFFIF